MNVSIFFILLLNVLIGCSTKKSSSVSPNKAESSSVSPQGVGKQSESVCPNTSVNFDQYSEVRKIGSGYAGTVLEVCDIKTGKHYVLKTLKDSESLLARKNDYTATVDMDQQIKDLNISTRIIQQLPPSSLLLDLINGVTLEKYFNSPNLKADEAFGVAIRYLDLEEKLLNIGVMPFDIHENNVMLSHEDGNLHIVDFGMFVSLNEERTFLENHPDQRFKLFSPAFYKLQGVKDDEATNSKLMQFQFQDAVKMANLAFKVSGKSPSTEFTEQIDLELKNLDNMPIDSIEQFEVAIKKYETSIKSLRFALVLHKTDGMASGHSHPQLALASGASYTVPEGFEAQESGNHVMLKNASGSIKMFLFENSELAINLIMN